MEGKIEIRIGNIHNVAIDWLKFFAVFLVMNSHMQMCYPKYGFLATGKGNR